MRKLKKNKTEKMIREHQKTIKILPNLPHLLRLLEGLKLSRLKRRDSNPKNGDTKNCKITNLNFGKIQRPIGEEKILIFPNDSTRCRQKKNGSMMRVITRD